MRILPGKEYEMLRCIIAMSSILIFCSVLWSSEPLEIGDEPQYVFDLHVVDNHWANKYKRHAVKRVFHRPEKHPDNPLFQDGRTEVDAPLAGNFCVEHDDESGFFRAWYKVSNPNWRDEPGPHYAMAYAESEDGLNWERPSLGLFEWRNSKDNNICWISDSRGGDGTVLLDLPEEARRGHRYVMLFRDSSGIKLVGSKDGIHWDRNSVQYLKNLHSDTLNNLVYDPERNHYVLFCRPKDIYRSGQKGGMINTGASRRMARMVHDTLWSHWPADPETILIPDELDNEEHFNFFYGMPTRYHGGLYWGFLWSFRMNTMIHTELAFSRDGEDFERLPRRPKLIARGEQGAWDDSIVRGTTWIEVGDEWWIYYTGQDTPHGERSKSRGVGLATVRKEGLVSLRGPRNGGGVVVTRKLRWPGGHLVVNADARGGEMKVRVSDSGREPLDGFDYRDCRPFTGDSTSHVVRWGDRTAESLKGRVVRLEFLLTGVDLYTFRADPEAKPLTVKQERAMLPVSTGPPEGGTAVFYAPFDEGEGTPTDLSDTAAPMRRGDPGNPATHPQWTEDGRDGAALRFSDSRYLEVDHNPAYRPANGRLELWFRPSDSLSRSSVRRNRYLWYMHASSKRRAGLFINGDNGRLSFMQVRRDEPSVRIESDADQWETGRWYHVAVTFGDGGMAMYVDGKLQRQYDPADYGLREIDRGPMHIGRGGTGRSNSFPGAIDDVRIIRHDTR
jgi:hypothetical protein